MLTLDDNNLHLMEIRFFLSLPPPPPPPRTSPSLVVVEKKNEKKTFISCNHSINLKLKQREREKKKNQKAVNDQDKRNVLFFYKRNKNA